MTKPNPVRKWTLAILAVVLVVFAYSLVSDRLSPYTPQAQIRAFVVGVAPEVAGRIVDVAVIDNQRVEAGQLLFRIDPENYRLAVQQADARLAAVGQSLGASTAEVSMAEAKFSEAIAQRDNVREQVSRIMVLVEKDIYSKARADQATAQMKTAEAAVRAAESDIERARQNLGPQGDQNPQIQEALAALARARLDLLRTDVMAPSDGLVTNLQLSVGRYASPGQPLLTFIDLRDIWLNAEFRENSLGNVAPGDRAEVVFDVLPGRVFDATVRSIGWGVAAGQSSPGAPSGTGDLPTIRNQSGWVRDPQRFPVLLDIATDKPPLGVRYGSQANVIVYASDDPVTRAIGWLWIRIVALFTYVI